MRSQGVGRRTIAELLAFVALLFALFWFVNLCGYTALLVTRFQRTNSVPVVVPLPSMSCSVTTHAQSDQVFLFIVPE
jgi:hypothetical protein